MSAEQADDQPSVITVDLTEEQSRLIREQSGGRLEISQFKLRPDRDMDEAVRANARTRAPDDAESTIAPPPRGTYWC